MKKSYHNQNTGTGLIIALILIIMLQPGCKKLIKVDLPVDKITAQAVYSNTGSAVSALNGIYISMSQGSFAGGAVSIAGAAGTMSDELADSTDAGKFGLYVNSYPYDPTTFWPFMYNYMFSVNSVIEGVTASTGIPAGSKQILLGEAKVLRALIYFNLVNMYGDVPLVTTTNFKTNSNIPRSPVATVYAQMIKDLTDAQQGLTDQYLGLDLSSTTTDRVRPNKAAATALLARVYLYLGQWQNAEDQASKLINNTAVYSLPDPNSVFLANSPEAIWQLQSIFNPDNGLSLTADASYFIPNPGDMPQVVISSFLLNAFEAGDMRKDAWIRIVNSGDDYPIPNKYKSGLDGFAGDPENEVVFRLGEQYLIRAEARAQLGVITGANSAKTDLDAIRTRAGLPGTTASDKPTMLAAIMHERQVELFSEWGHRWFDLKRTGKVDGVMSTVTPAKGGSWAPYKALLPIPQTEFQLNPALKGHQNPGYSEL